MTAWEDDAARDAEVTAKLAEIRAEARRRVPEWEPWMTARVGFGACGFGGHMPGQAWNNLQQMLGGNASAERAEWALDVVDELGSDIPEQWRSAALARIADPSGSWADIGDALGLTKHQARGFIRSLVDRAERLAPQ